MDESGIKAEDYYPYEPPTREYSTLLAFSDWLTASAWKVRVAPDPLGPVNKIVTLLRGGQPVTSVLYPVNKGDSVRLVRDENSWTMDEVFALRNRMWNARDKGEEPELPPVRKPGWRVEINGTTVLSVTDAELRPTPTPAPRTPLWRRMRQALLDQVRADADAIAGRFGYHRDDDCGRWDY